MNNINRPSRANLSGSRLKGEKWGIKGTLSALRAFSKSDLKQVDTVIRKLDGSCLKVKGKDMVLFSSASSPSWCPIGAPASAEIALSSEAARQYHDPWTKNANFNESKHETKDFISNAVSPVELVRQKSLEHKEYKGTNWTPSSFQLVPEDIWMMIASFLDIHSHSRLAAVNRDIYLATRFADSFPPVINLGGYFVQRSPKRVLQMLLDSQIDHCITFDISSSSIESPELQLIAKLPMETLSLADCRSLTNEDLKIVAEMKSLKGLNLLMDKYVNDVGLAHLQNMRLTELNLFHTRITDQGLVHLADMPLQYLNISECKNITNRALANINMLPLKSLILDECKISDAALFDLAPLASTLEHLSLSHCGISNTGLHSLTDMKFPNLTSLNISNCRSIKDSGLAHLANFHCTLKKLDISQNNLTDHGIFHLRSLQQLNVLNVNHCSRLTVASMKYVAELKSLKCLLLRHVRLTDDGLKQLAGLQLEQLDLGYCSWITDEGIGALVGMPLKALSVGHCRLLTLEGVSMFSYVPVVHHSAMLRPRHDEKKKRSWKKGSTMSTSPFHSGTSVARRQSAKLANLFSSQRTDPVPMYESHIQYELKTSKLMGGRSIVASLPAKLPGIPSAPSLSTKSPGIPSAPSLSTKSPGIPSPPSLLGNRLPAGIPAPPPLPSHDSNYQKRKHSTINCVRY